MPCNGGANRTPSGEAAIKALSWAEVDEIRAQFEDLNPYRPEAVDESVLELEDENYKDPGAPSAGSSTASRQR